MHGQRDVHRRGDRPDVLGLHRPGGRPDQALSEDGWAAELASRLEHAFEARRDAGRALAMSRYMRDRFAFYGIAAPEQRLAARDAAKDLPLPSQDELVAFVTSCWLRDEREWQYAACDALRSHVRHCDAGLLTTVERLITARSWWDTVDTLAVHTVGPLVRANPQLVGEMDRWIAAEDVWLARSAILHQVGFKRHTDASRLFAYCERRASDRELFLRKAIGWALREYTKTDPAAVRAFVAARADVLSPLSMREALRRLDGPARQSKRRSGS